MNKQKLPLRDGVGVIILNNDNLEGHNTDVEGFTKAIKNLNFNMQRKKIFILGAGGVVPSIIFALKKMNVSQIVVSNRTKKKAEDLNSQFHNLKIFRVKSPVPFMRR